MNNAAKGNGGAADRNEPTNAKQKKLEEKRKMRKAAELRTTAEQLAKSGKHQDALGHFTRSLGIYPSALTFAMRAALNVHLNNTTNALQDADSALGLEPNFVPAFNAKGRALYKEGRVNELMVVIEQLKRIDSNAAMELQKSTLANIASMSPFLAKHGDVFRLMMSGEEGLKEIPHLTGRKVLYMIIPADKQGTPSSCLHQFQCDTLPKLKKELDKIAADGGKLWSIQLNTLLVDEPLLKFFRSIEPKFLLGNELVLNSVQCSGKCFREMFSDGLFNPLSLHLNHMDKIELDWKQNEFSKILNEIPALWNVRNLYLHDALMGTYSGKRTPNLCPYFYDKKAILDFMHRPWHKPDNWPSYGEKYKSVFEGNARRMTIDLERMGGGIGVEEIVEECKKRMNMDRPVRQDFEGKIWMDATSPISRDNLEGPEVAVSYSIEVFSPDAKMGYNWLSGVSQAVISRAGNEVFAVEPQHSSSMRPDGLPAYFATVIQRMGHAQFAKTRLGLFAQQQEDGQMAKMIQEMMMGMRQ